MNDTVTLIASGYEWTCPNESCRYVVNKEIEITEEVKCRKCKKVYKVIDQTHTYE